MSEYEKKANDFLTANGIKFRATFKDAKCPPYCDGKHIHGERYRVTLHRPGQPGRLSFDFWNSQHDMEAGEQPTAYDVLACISSDLNCPESFKEFCGEYGYEEDSRKAYATFKRCASFAKRLNAFFTDDKERADLGEIS